MKANTGKTKPAASLRSRLISLPRKGQTVLITGGAGFLGSALCSFYMEQETRVICLDDLSTGRVRNIDHFLESPNFTFVKQDVADPFDPEDGIDFIFNMACPASPVKYQADPIKTFRTIVAGSENMLQLAQRKGARILEASTSEIYGDPEVSPQVESYRGSVNTMGPRSCYDEGKRAAETLFHEYRAQNGVDARVARIFNTYGPGMDPEDGRVISNFLVQALKGAPLTIYGDGKQTRSFCYVDDMIAGLVSLMHAEGDMSGPVNLGNPGEFTVIELARIVLEETGSDSPLEMRPLPVDDPKLRRPEIQRAREELGWEPTVALREGLRLSIPYFASEIAMEGRSQKVVER